MRHRALVFRSKSVTKLDYTNTIGLPIYYSCDWDYDGLSIIYPLVKEKIPAIQLLTPNGSPKGIEETVKYVPRKLFVKFARDAIIILFTMYEKSFISINIAP